MPGAPEQGARYERKFLSMDFSAEAIQRMISMHPFHFREIHAGRFVNSVYLDTPTLADFRAHVAGTDTRQKFRVRWYGSRVGQIAKPTLEVKRRHGYVGTKILCPVEPFEYRDALTVESIRLAKGTKLGPEYRARLTCSLPAVLTRYHRRYYLTANERFRMTVDTEISYHAVGEHLHSYVRHHEEPRLTVIELKYDVADDREIQALTNCLPFRLGKYSKYVAGIERLSASST